MGYSWLGQQLEQQFNVMNALVANWQRRVANCQLKFGEDDERATNAQYPALLLVRRVY